MILIEADCSPWLLNPEHWRRPESFNNIIGAPTSRRTGIGHAYLTLLDVSGYVQCTCSFKCLVCPGQWSWRSSNISGRGPQPTLQENASSIPVSVGRLTWCRGDVTLSQAITLPHRLAHGFARNYKYRKCIPYVGLCRTHALDTHTLIIKGFH